MKDDNTTLTYRCPEQDFNTLRELCEKNDMLPSDFVIQALLMYTDLAEKQGLLPAQTAKNTPNHG